MAVRTSYEVRCGERLLSFQRANTAREAVVEYLLSMGCRTDEIVSAAGDAVTWRGAVYRAVPLGTH